MNNWLVRPTTSISNLFLFFTHIFTTNININIDFHFTFSTSLLTKTIKPIKYTAFRLNQLLRQNRVVFSANWYPYNTLSPQPSGSSFTIVL